jgi:hypothetical protein
MDSFRCPKFLALALLSRARCEGAPLDLFCAQFENVCTLHQWSGRVLPCQERCQRCDNAFVQIGVCKRLVTTHRMSCRRLYRHWQQQCHVRHALTYKMQATTTLSL